MRYSIRTKFRFVDQDYNVATVYALAMEDGTFRIQVTANGKRERETEATTEAGALAQFVADCQSLRDAGWTNAPIA